MKTVCAGLACVSGRTEVPVGYCKHFNILVVGLVTVEIEYRAHKTNGAFRKLRLLLVKKWFLLYGAWRGIQYLSNVFITSCLSIKYLFVGFQYLLHFFICTQNDFYWNEKYIKYIIKLYLVILIELLVLYVFAMAFINSSVKLNYII